MKLFLILIGFLLTTASLRAQKADDHISKGNELYKQQKFEEAEKEFAKALELEPDNKIIINNLASVKHRLNKPDEAKKEFEKLLSEKNDNTTRATAHYNIGAILSKEKKLEESIEAYKNSLRLDPNDKEARENLQKALLELKKKQQPEKKENKNKKKQEKQQKQPQSKMNRKEVEKQLQLLQQKEKEVKQRMQNEKMKETGANPKDW